MLYFYVTGRNALLLCIADENWKLVKLFVCTCIGTPIAFCHCTPFEINVVQEDNDLSIERHSEWQGLEYTTNDKFTLDGKECINAGWMDSQKKSTAVWADDKKSLKINSKIPMQDGGEISISEVYKIDGENMVIDMNSSSSFGDMSETQVYDKK